MFGGSCCLSRSSRILSECHRHFTRTLNWSTLKQQDNLYHLCKLRLARAELEPLVVQAALADGDDAAGARRARCLEERRAVRLRRPPGLLGWHYLSNAICLNTASVCSCAVYSVKDHRTLRIYSALLKETCVRQVVLDKWFPLNSSNSPHRVGWTPTVQKSSGQPSSPRQ